MMDRRIADIFAECLEWIAREGGTVEQAVSRYPEHAAELRSLISAVDEIANSASVEPSLEFQAVAKTRLLNRISALPEVEPKPDPVTFSQRPRLIPQKQRKSRSRRFSMAWLMVIVAAVSVVLGGGGVAYASTDALPGDALYPVKSVVQEIELAFSGDEGDIDLLLGFMQDNIDGMGQLAAQGRWDDLEEELDEYEENYEDLLQTRSRVSYEDAPSEDALNNRIQTELHTQAQLLLQLQTRLQEQDRLQDKIQEAIQLTDQGNVYGPSDGGAPEDGGAPNGVGPGEPQGTQTQADSQGQQGQPDDTQEPGNDEAPQNGEGCGQQTGEDGQELETDELCGQEGNGAQGEGKGTGQGGKP
jgi:hypothetical protein